MSILILVFLYISGDIKNYGDYGVDLLDIKNYRIIDLLEQLQISCKRTDRFPSHLQKDSKSRQGEENQADDLEAFKICVTIRSIDSLGSSEICIDRYHKRCNNNKLAKFD